MSIKYLRVTMPDGSKWDVAASYIAQNRADWYEENEGADHRTIFNETMDDDYELKDWAAGNMDWDEVKAGARMVQTQPETDYQEGWVNGEQEIVEY